MVQFHLFSLFILTVSQSTFGQHSNNSSSSDKCYGALGCFGTRDFSDLNGQPITFAPQSPEEINITFKLFTPENPYSSIDFKYNLEQFQLNNSPFDARKKVKFIIHGFTSSFDEMDWMGKLKDLILEGQPNQYNVFGVDWSNGAKTINYFQAVANTRVVGAALAHFIKKLNQISGLKFSNVHLIGHSLGAHVSGYAGERIQNPKIGRITGLDPAGPSFYSNESSLRLDPSDASYVDAIHTDYGNLVVEGLGIEDALGDIDFYPNGGYRQPACGKTKGLFNVLNQGVIKGISETISCNHQFAPRLMLINPEQLTENCQFVGYQCSNYDDYEKGKCTDCGTDGKKCAVLSIFGETDRGSGQAFQEQKQTRFRDAAFKKYYYKTGAQSPYCLHHYGIEIHLANNSESGTGSFTLDLEGSKRKADGIKVSETFSSFKPGQTYTFLVTYEKSLGSLRKAVMKWTFKGIDVLNPLKLISSPKMIIDRLAIKYMSNIDPRLREEESSILCPEQSDTVSNGKQINFVPCRGGQGSGNSISRLNNGQKNQSQHQGNNAGTWSNSQKRPQSNGYTTPGYSTPRYQTSTSHPNGGDHRITSNYSSSSNNRRPSYSTSLYQTTPSYNDSSIRPSTSRYQPVANYHTPSSYHASFNQRPFSSSSPSSLYSPLNTWNRRPASPSLWTQDEPLRSRFRPHRDQIRPFFYSSLTKSSSDPRVKLHLGDNVGEIYRNLGESSFFTSDSSKILPSRTNQKFEEMFKTSTPSLFLSSDLHVDGSVDSIVIASNSRSPGSWRDVPDRRFGEFRNKSARLVSRQRSQTNGKVLNFDGSTAESDEMRQK
ncbi:inactive pancreatic lipase-related protein 1 [Tetranychus urticae]|nr:inactive pancreatic lipase-related protein 1 [Tetranychus urticae]